MHSVSWVFSFSSFIGVLFDRSCGVALCLARDSLREMEFEGIYQPVDLGIASALKAKSLVGWGCWVSGERYQRGVVGNSGSSILSLLPPTDQKMDLPKYFAAASQLSKGLRGGPKTECLGPGGLGGLGWVGWFGVS